MRRDGFHVRSTNADRQQNTSSRDRRWCEWCRRWDSNPRPRDYETLALPLSYTGTNQTYHAMGRGIAVKNASRAVVERTRGARESKIMTECSSTDVLLTAAG